MKKIIVILFCFYVGNVCALEYSDYTDMEVKSDEFTDVKVERRYKYYKLVREDGPYEEKDIVNDDYPYMDESDYMYTLESDYLLDEPLEKEGRVITKHVLYRHLKADDITYIRICNNNYNDVSLNYYNFNVLYKGNVLDYDVAYKNADEFSIMANGEILLKFNEKIDVRYLTLSFDVVFSDTRRTDLNINLGNDRLQVGKARYVFQGENKDNVKFNGINMDTFSNAFVYYYSDKIEETRPTIYYHDMVIGYTYKDILYRKYNMIREYYDDYLAEGFDDYIYKDENDFKDYYAYRIRDVLEKKNVDDKKEDNEIKRLDTKSGYVVYQMLNREPEKDNTSTDTVFKTVSSGIIKANDEAKLEKDNILIYYFNYFLISIVILILVLSKLYKKYFKRAMV